jgi:branched-subunit amino acid aminotransferase/4-amino-4-deoxychorismate lyase
LSLPGWIDGQLVPAGAGALPLGDSAHASGLGCYTSARWLGGAVWHGERSARRLVRDARALGIGEIAEGRVLQAMAELGDACFGAAPGIVRFEASRSAAGAVCLTGTARALGAEPRAWRAICAPFPHPGPAPWGGAKVTSHLLFVAARERAAEAGVEESLLFDATGRLVEAARTSPLFVRADGALCTPPLARGGVAGVGLEVLGARFPELREADLRRGELGTLRELIAMNSVRGPVPIVEIDGRPVATGEPGPWALRLRDALAPPV